MSNVSLIPYLEPGDGKFSLNIVSPDPPADSEKQTRYPFQLLNDADPFSRLFEARIVSGGEQSATRLFLLVQRDSYRYKPDEIWSLTNPDLDGYWQQTFSAVSSGNNLQNRFFPLKETAFPEGGLLPFRSLFYCTHKKLFFHPPCPSCGTPLELCENDQLLSLKGLTPYGSTLKRYLFCPSCQQEGSDVYTYIREDTDPPIVKDCYGLLRSWRDIAAGRIPSRNFPCANCPEQTACYGETAFCTGRIIPFNFFPSYILAFRAGSMSAVDFLPLISGAAVDEIVPPLIEKKQHGRLTALLEWRQTHGNGDLFLYNGKPEQFLEILYLKLSFLGDISRIVLAPDTAPMPLDIFAVIDCLWVNLPHHNSLLPGLWHYKTELFAVGPCKTDAGTLTASHPSQARYCLGIIWFFALLRNRRQSVHEIKKSLEQILRQPAETVSVSELSISAPKNIFWDPDTRKSEEIPAEWRLIWAQAISLGEHLFRGNSLEKAGDENSNFFSDIERIRGEIRQLLFYKERGQDATFYQRRVKDAAVSQQGETEAAVPPKNVDTEIHRILSRILKRWQSDEKPPTPLPQTEEETLTQTVVLSGNSDTGFSETIVTTAEQTGLSKPAEETLAETVILKADTAPPKMSDTLQNRYTPGETSTADENAEEELQETVILKKGANPQGMPETVRNVPAPGGDNTTDMGIEETLQETVILKRNVTPPKIPEPVQNTYTPGETNGADENNSMPETLILKPSYTKDKHKNS